MSGSFEELDVPPTLVSFAVSTTDTQHIVSTEWKQAGHKLALLRAKVKENGLPDFDSRARGVRPRGGICEKGKAASTPRGWSASAALPRACSRWGWATSWASGLNATFPMKSCLRRRPPRSCSSADAAPEGCELLGEITADYALTFRGETLSMDALQKPYEEKLQSVFPYLTPSKDEAGSGLPRHGQARARPAPQSRSRACSSRSSPAPTANTTPPAPLSAPAPSRRSWSCATCTAQDIEESIAAFVKLAQDAQIIALPGGFSGGDEPEGSRQVHHLFPAQPAVHRRGARAAAERATA